MFGLDELAKINHILISHSHLDHVLSIGLLADSVARRRVDAPPIRVHALQATLEALRAHIFNGVIWPDFTRLPSAEHPILAFEPFAIRDVLTFGKRRIDVLPAVHTVPAVGFAALDDSGAWAFTGDTGPNPALRQRLQSMAVAHLVIETAFSDEERALAKISSHLCPSMLGKELVQLEGSVAVNITHIKPGEIEAVMGQIEALGSRHRISPLVSGEAMRLGAAAL